MSERPAIELPGIELLERIGEGGMSTVWKAWDSVRNRTVAVKVLNRELSASGDDVCAFRKEERIMEEIRHPGIVQAYDLASSNGYWCFEMEFVDGYTFAELLRRKQRVPEEDCLLICESVAVALDYAWNDHGVVHCDIKPENIMIAADGTVKLTDLGISHRYEYADGVQEASEHVTGTPAYMSPEQVYGDVELDCRTDIYSLGATLYHLSTGRVLFPRLGIEDTMRAHCDEGSRALDPRLYRPGLSDGFAQLLEVMLVKDRNERVSSWSDVCSLCKDVERGIVFKPRVGSAVSSILLKGGGDAD